MEEDEKEEVVQAVSTKRDKNYNIDDIMELGSKLKISK